jgi:hypothetical protein
VLRSFSENVNQIKLTDGKNILILNFNPSFFYADFNSLILDKIKEIKLEGFKFVFCTEYELLCSTLEEVDPAMVNILPSKMNSLVNVLSHNTLQYSDIINKIPNILENKSYFISTL